MHVYGYVYVNACVCPLLACIFVCLPEEIYIWHLYLCSLCPYSPAAQFRIHQSVLSPGFGSPTLAYLVESMKDITWQLIHHDRAIQQSVRPFRFGCMPLQLFFFNKTSHPANATSSLQLLKSVV